MKFLTVILFCLYFLSNSSYGQSNFNDCNVLSFIIKSNEANKIFFLDKYKQAPLVLVDTGHYFRNCESLPTIYERVVTISDDNTLLNKASTSTLAIFGYTKKSNRYKVKFFYKQTGAIGFIEVKKVGIHYKILNS